MQKSYCYTPGVRVRVRVSVGVRMQNVRANVKVMEFQSLCIFSCILTLLIMLIKPLTTKAHDRRASGDCGTSGFLLVLNTQTSGSNLQLLSAERLQRDVVRYLIRNCESREFYLERQKSWDNLMRCQVEATAIE